MQLEITILFAFQNNKDQRVHKQRILPFTSVFIGHGILLRRQDMYHGPLIERFCENIFA